MSEILFSTVSTCSKNLMKFGFTVDEFASLAQKNNMSGTGFWPRLLRARHEGILR